MVFLNLEWTEVLLFDQELIGKCAFKSKLFDVTNLVEAGAEVTSDDGREAL